MLASAIDAEPGELGAEYAGLAADGRLDRGARRRRVPRAPVLDGRPPGGLELPAGVAGIEVYNAGCELEVGRGLSGVHWDELLEAGAPLLRDRDRRLAPPGLRLRPRLGVAAGCRSDRATRCSTRCGAGSFYGSTGPRLPRRRARRRLGRGARAARARRSRSSPGASEGAAAHAGRLPYAIASRVLERADDGRITRAQLEIPVGAAPRSSRARRRRRRARLDEPLLAVSSRDRALEQLAGRRFDLLVIGGGIVGAGDRGGGGSRRARRRARRARRLRRRDLERARRSSSTAGLRYLRLGDLRLVREAHQERRALLRTSSRRTSCAGSRSCCRSIAMALSGRSSSAPVSGSTRCSRATGSAGSSSRRGRGAASPICASKACAAAASTRTRGRTTPALPRERARSGGRRRDRAQLRRGDGSAHRRRRDRRGGGARRRDRRRRLGRARAVVNAAGPWVDHVRRLEIRGRGASVTL